MRDQPDPAADPYRTLGLEPGAPMAEVKRAYRRLAKAYHPDSAGEVALPRFLAIHEAYERLTTGRVRSSARPPTGATSTPAEPWRADPDRARAARERARRRTGTTGAGGRTGTAGPSFESGRRRPTGSTGSGSSSRTSGPAGAGTKEKGRRHVRKATMGSTSYDEARDPADATWSGASWYGPTSGEYWIVNPREYADPRKHGPGYQQRARRAASTTAADTTAGDVAGDETETELDDGDRSVFGSTATEDGDRASGARARAADRANPSARPGPDSWRSRDARRWDASAHAGWRPAPEASARGVSPGDARAGFDPRSLAGSGRDWLGGPADDPIRRLGIALVAWPPMGLAAAAAIGDLTGCSSFSAECGGTDALLPWLAQAAILGLLLLLPPLARLLVGGTIAILFALIPITMFLLAVGATGAPQAGFALGVLLAVAWVGGVGWVALGGRGQGRVSAGRTPPGAGT